MLSNLEVLVKESLKEIILGKDFKVLEPAVSQTYRVNHVMNLIGVISSLLWQLF